MITGPTKEKKRETDQQQNKKNRHKHGAPVILSCHSHLFTLKANVITTETQLFEKTIVITIEFQPFCSSFPRSYSGKCQAS